MQMENFQMFKMDLEKAEEPEIKLPTSNGLQKKQENSRKTSTSASLTMLKRLTVWITANSGKFLEMRIPDHLTCFLCNLYTGQKTIVRTRHETMDWFKIGKRVCQRCIYILSPCLFNLHSEYIMKNARLDEAQARIKITRKSINSLALSFLYSPTHSLGILLARFGTSLFFQVRF